MLMVKISRPSGGATLNKMERVKISASKKSIICITIGNSFKLDRQLRNDCHNFIGRFCPTAIFNRKATCASARKL